MLASGSCGTRKSMMLFAIWEIQDECSDLRYKMNVTNAEPAEQKVGSWSDGDGGGGKLVGNADDDQV